VLRRTRRRAKDDEEKQEGKGATHGPSTRWQRCERMTRGLNLRQPSAWRVGGHAQRGPRGPSDPRGSGASGAASGRWSGRVIPSPDVENAISTPSRRPSRSTEERADHARETQALVSALTSACVPSAAPRSARAG
jgi:hypothetical protein